MIIKDKVKMPVLNKKIRQTNFEEVACGYDIELAKLEAKRCLDCKNPKCIAACPVQVPIPEFIKLILEDKLDEAYYKIYEDNILPAICGRVCPQEKQCEGACIVGIKGDSVSIGALERFIGDYALDNDLSKNETIIEKNIKVAVIGSGPAGLSASASLRRLGYDVTVYEALHDFGGVLKYGIPDFRLPKNIVTTEINKLRTMGVKFEKNVIIGKSITIDQLLNEYNYQSIFLGTGAGLPSSLKIKGENFSGVYYANEFLTRVNLMKSHTFPKNPTPVKVGDNVAVVGGGNVAMDAARTAKRLGAKNVFILYRRDMDALPARLEEIHHAIEEGIDFRLLKNPVELIGDKYIVKQVKCEIMELGEPDKSGRRRPIGTNKYEIIDIDSCIISIGQLPNPILRESTDKLDVDDWGRIKTNVHMTSIDGVFAGGDVVSGAATVILAMGAGKEAAVEMDKYIQSKKQ
ncbi:glutamate synthase (NADPH), homotetrameric [Candidatus Izimaplasma bacterium ZiA1]|uniref:NADPH-dependent glutamate synthase n=1 Tax=Candidatus Izimoplasma sp. ZiA1 TaxID=2024899 RepID=UPI000BAA528E|nr:glutamate synthase (NADPH), homotetrameric [Candidatus Izimaplasma bacterium ZiA1]